MKQIFDVMVSKDKDFPWVVRKHGKALRYFRDVESALRFIHLLKRQQ